MLKTRDKNFRDKFFPDITLEPASPVELHHQIAEQIKRAIVANRVPAGVPIIAERQIAEKSDTSRQTVHKAYAQLLSEGIIEKRAGRHNLFVSVNARAFYRKPLPVQGIILPCSYSEFLRISSQGSMDYFSGVVDRVDELKYSLMIISLPPVSSPVSEIRAWIGHLTSRLNGIVNFGISRAPGDRIFKELLEITQIPHVFIAGCSDGHGHISYVHEDIAPGGIAAAQLLRDNGHNSAAVIQLKKRTDRLISVYHEKRGPVITEIFSKSGLSINEKWIASCGVDEASIAAAARGIFSQKKRPTALWCQNDYFAGIAVSTLAQMGLKVPEDVSVIGYDDSKEAAECNPPLTTIKMPNYLIGRLAADLANELFEQGVPGEARTATVPTSLILRGSVAKAKNDNKQEF
jgi:DNA-binding LacI/PurR family transcriptional regulator